MIVYRIVSDKHSNDLSGEGSAIYGGRWNSKGKPVVYTGGSIEIALLEVLVNITTPQFDNYNLVKIDIPDDSIYELRVTDLPKNWKNYPAPTEITMIGDKWINSNRSVALKVPSCIVPTAYNYILNCSHTYFKKVKIIDLTPFKIDNRLM